MATKNTPVITGWLKKEADKGLKVGNLIKKPFNDRWFVLDNTDCRLYYYEKQASEVPNGFVDLVKVVKLGKTGKSDIEFSIETNDELDGTKIYTLHAPSAAQMDLWIKAITIVMGIAKSKAKPTSNMTTKIATQTSSDSTVIQSASPSTEASSSSTSKTSFGEALKDPAKKEHTAAIEPTESEKPPTSATLPTRVNTSDPAPPKSTGAPVKESFATAGPSSAKGKVSGTGGFLSRQRASAHPSTPPKPQVSPGIASLSSTFQTSNGDSASSWRKSTPHPTTSPSAKSPTNTTSQPKLRTSQESTTVSTPSPILTPPATYTTPTPTNSSIPSSTPKTAFPSEPEKPNNTIKRNLTEPTPAVNPPTVNASPPKSSPAPAPVIVTGSHRSSDVDIPPSADTTTAAPVAETFKIGGLEVTLKSSLSSLAPQKLGASLLSDADFLQIDTPLIKSSGNNEASSSAPATSVFHSSLGLLSGSGIPRSKPQVPSPMSLLEDRINRAYQEDMSSQLVEPASSHGGAKRLETPDELVEALKSSKENPDTEVRIELNEWTLIGLKRSWAVQQMAYRNKDNEGEIPTETLDDAYDPETSYTWQLPGFITVRWYRHNTWSVTTREVGPGDEIKWDLLSVGKSLQAMDSVIPIPRQALVYHLYSVVQKLKDKCFHLRAAYEVPIEQKGDMLDEKKDSTLSQIIRGDLCTRLAAVLLDGFNDWSLLRKYHIWDFILEAGSDRNLATHDLATLQLSATVKEINLTPTDPNVKFRTFIVSALNQRQLFSWMKTITQNKEEVEDYYDEISLLRQIPVMVLNALAPLSDLPFQLSTKPEPTPAPAKKTGFLANLSNITNMAWLEEP